MNLWTSRAHELRTAQARILADALLSIDPNDPPDPKVYRTTAGGDTRKLRGIPAIGPGVAGHIPGTNPGDIR